MQCRRTRNSYLWLVRTLLFSVASEGVVRDGEMMQVWDQEKSLVFVCIPLLSYISALTLAASIPTTLAFVGGCALVVRDDLATARFISASLRSSEVVPV